MRNDLRGKRVTVMGLGRFGGAIGAVRFLAGCGARLTITDLAGTDALAESLAQISDLPVERLRLGSHDPTDFLEADLVVASPAVPTGHPLLVKARSAGVPVTTETGLFWTRCPARVIGVTGSIGKSTTSAMIAALLNASRRRVWLGGNIGGSLLPELDNMSSDDWVVLELSSFQLDYLAPLRPRPAVAVVTNFEPNHLDWHGSLAAYRHAKQNLLRWQTAADVAVLNANDPDVAAWPTAAKKVWFSRTHEASRGTTAPFHPMNVAAATAAVTAIDVEPDAIVEGLANFRGLPHRLEIVGEFAGRLWVNDSKATTPAAAIAALSSFTRPIHLVAGGADKGVDLSLFADAIFERAASAHLSGVTAAPLAGLLRSRGTFPASTHASFDESVAAARRASQPGEVILLSPGCASWGQFLDYRERGERFARIARTSG